MLISKLVYQLIVLASETRKEDAITVAALDSYLVNIEFRFYVIFHRCNCFLRVYKLITGFSVRTVQPS